MAKVAIFGVIAFFVLMVFADMSSGGPTSRSADLRVAIDVKDDLDRSKVVGAIDDFSRHRNLSLNDASEAASDTLSTPTIVRFYEGPDRAVVFVTDRLERGTLLIGVHNAIGDPSAEKLDDALLRHLRRALQEFELVVNPQE